MSPVQAQDITSLDGTHSLIPPKLSDYEVVLKVRAALRQQDAGLVTRVEALRDIRRVVERAR